jgi:uncharacterized protein YjgD (DUF1641 family)
MAKPVTVFPGFQSQREVLLSKLSKAPVEHAAALLDLYELAQVLHEHGTLDLLRGFVGASDDVVGRLAAGLSQPESVRASRNIIEMAKLLSRVDPEQMRNAVDLGVEFFAAKLAEPCEPLGLWAIFRRMTSRDGRRALALIAESLNLLGRAADSRRGNGRTARVSE